MLAITITVGHVGTVTLVGEQIHALHCAAVALGIPVSQIPAARPVEIYEPTIGKLRYDPQLHRVSHGDGPTVSRQ